MFFLFALYGEGNILLRLVVFCFTALCSSPLAKRLRLKKDRFAPQEEEE